MSCDSPCNDSPNAYGPSDVHTPEFLNTITTSGLPSHKLRLKVDAPIMLLRIIDQNLGLCNGTRLIITKMGTYVLEAKVLS
jgi:ATP-dependent DNA helicase PIF1